MVTGTLKSKIDAVWNEDLSGGISNPLEVIDQLTYLLFTKGLDERQTWVEHKSNRTGEPIDDVIFPEGEEFIPEGRNDGVPYSDLRCRAATSAGRVRYRQPRHVRRSI